MIKIFVDSGSSITIEEKDVYGVEILPIRILLGDEEYLDGVNLSTDAFYAALENGCFPKTSLPSLYDAEQRVKQCVSEGYDVIVMTISSGISGTYNAVKNLFAGEDKVRVIDTETAVGGIKLLVKEANKYLDRSLDFVEQKIKELIPRIKVLAVPDTLEYLHKGGRLSKAGYVVGTLLKIKPIIELKHTVKLAGKVMGLNAAKRQLIASLATCDTEYPIIPSYTKDDGNLKDLISKTDEKYVKIMTEADNIDAAIAAHWGPGTFSYIFVEKA